MAVGVQGQVDSPAPDQPVHLDEVTPGILGLPEAGVGDHTGGIVHRQQQDEPWPPLLQPRMVAAINLDQHFGLWHTIRADPVLGRPTPARAKQSGSGQDTAHRLAAKVMPSLSRSNSVR